MTYSACDFTDDVLRCIGDAVAPAGLAESADLGEKADAAISAITGLAARARAACFVAEVLSAVESLGALREAVGTQALDYTLYLADAIRCRIASQGSRAVKTMRYSMALGLPDSSG